MAGTKSGKPDERLAFESPAAWEAWLAKNHARQDGITMRLAKKASGIPSVTYQEALDIALCYGWIDGQKGSESETFYTQRFTPRRARSVWSKINRDKVAALIQAGRMQPSGLVEVERAKKDGRWDAAYGGFSAKDAIPDDLAAALDKSPTARAFFQTLNAQNRYAILFRLHQAKKPETRAQRLAAFVTMLEKHETIYSQAAKAVKAKNAARKRQSAAESVKRDASRRKKR